MGHVQNKLTITVLLSNHNSMNDDLDYVKWEWFKRSVEELVKRHYGDDALTRQISGVNWEHRVDVEITEDHRGHFYLDELNKPRVGDRLEGLMD